MKKINKLKLNQLGKTELEKREMTTLKGGHCICADQYCGCRYDGPWCGVTDDYWGGSNHDDNHEANWEQETQRNALP